MLKVNFDLSSVIEAQIKEFTKEKKDFSAYSVTKELRTQFPNHFILHNDIKSLVHEIMDENEYYEKSDNGRFINYVFDKISDSSLVSSPMSSLLDLFSKYQAGGTYMPSWLDPSSDLGNFTNTQSSKTTSTSKPSTTDTPGVSATMDSSVIGQVSYLDNFQTLIISINESLYAYENVPKNVYMDFLISPSKGSFYNHNIKGKYKSKKIEF